jgi:cell division protein FtsL
MTIRHHHENRSQYTSRFCVIFFSFSLMILFASIGFYLASTNAIAIQGNNSNRSEQRIRDLSKEYRRLQMEVAELSSLRRLQDRQGEFQTISPDEILYVTGSRPLASR